MKKGYLWAIFLVVGIMALTTVCYFTMVKNAKTNYANGQLVERTIVEWSEYEV